MKILVITFTLVFTQSLMAKIADFNSLIQQQSKAQKEIHLSLNEDNIETIEISGTQATKAHEILVVSTDQVLVPSTLLASVKTTQLQKLILMEEKQFQILGDELKDAQ